MGGGKPFRVIQGKVYVIGGDELVTEDDPKGDTKIDKNGNLLGGRRFKAQTFNLPNRHPERMFMLAIDAARTSGFRDSLYYFRRNPLAHKLNATQIEKEFLIEIGKLGSHLRTRSVTLITARSAFKLHGSKTLIGAYMHTCESFPLSNFISIFFFFIDGRWVVDDYYEDKVLADITEKGLKPGDLVGELADPNAPSAAALAAAELANAQKADRAGGTQGIYRAGGPTTLFGGPGWGPYSDGPLNAVRKSLLNRDGLNEENWMLVAAQRTAEASAEWAKQRRRALVPYGGIFGAAAAAAAAAGKYEEEEEDRGGLGEEDHGKAKGKGKGQGLTLTQGQQEQDGHPGQEHAHAQDRRDNDASARRRKRARREDKVPRGVYEPHSGIVLYRANTQPTRARWEGLKDSGEKRQVLGGTKAGNGAWALAWVDTIMEVPASEEDDAIGRAAAEERQRLLQLAANDLNSS
ncbi:chromatin remodelling complex Rsc7/Swp82 subunit-domain-containing protein [Russula emetica]|nr:chromatin remodelling complex Rsc7/Swp82 subunit-domain-containing protein [Russula emetica]